MKQQRKDGPFRKAGQKLREIDDAYSRKIVDMYVGPEGNSREYMQNPVLGAAAGIASVFAGGTPVSALKKGSNVEKGAALSSAAAKYAAPAAATGLAAYGVADVINKNSSELPM